MYRSLLSVTAHCKSNITLTGIAKQHGIHSLVNVPMLEGIQLELETQTNQLYHNLFPCEIGR